MLFRRLTFCCSARSKNEFRNTYVQKSYYLAVITLIGLELWNWTELCWLFVLIHTLLDSVKYYASIYVIAIKITNTFNIFTNNAMFKFGDVPSKFVDFHTGYLEHLGSLKLHFMFTLCITFFYYFVIHIFENLAIVFLHEKLHDWHLNKW